MAVGAHSPPTIIAVTSVLLSMVWITLVMRLYIRFFIAKSFGWDDFFIIVAVLHVTLCGVSLCVGTVYGLTQHIETLSPDQLRSFFISFYCLGAGYVGSSGYIKISLLFQYMRVFEKGSRPYRIAQCMIVFIGLWTFGFVFTNWFGCFPSPSNFWDKRGKGCYGSFSNNIFERNRTIEAHSGGNTIQDFMILGLGFYLFSAKDKDGLALNRKGLSVVLAMGAVASGFSVWRFSDVIILFSGPGINDVTFNIAPVFLNSTVEVSIGALCATTPFFWPLIESGMNMIFVKYEFTVQTESRYDDQIELASTASHDKQNFRDNKTGSSYTDDYSETNTDPFRHEFGTESMAKRGSGVAGTKERVREFRREV